VGGVCNSAPKKTRGRMKKLGKKEGSAYEREERFGAGNQY